MSEETRGQRDNDVATTDYEVYHSKLDEKHLQELAQEIQGNYVRGDNRERVFTAMRQQKINKPVTTLLQINRLLAAIAGLMILAAYIPQYWLNYLSRLKFSRYLKTQN